MSPDAQQKWMAYIRDYQLHAKFPEPTDAEGQGLTDASNAVKAAQRIKDKILWMKQNNIPMDGISQDELIRSKEAGWAESAHSPAEKFMWGWWSKFEPKNNFADELGQDYQVLNTHLAKTPGGTYPHAATPNPEQWDWELPIPATNEKVGFKLPKTTDVSTIPPLNKIGSGDTHDEALTHIQEVLNNAVGDYRKIVSKLPKAGFRVPEEDTKNIADLADQKKGYIDDGTNKMRDKDGNLVNGYGQIPQPPPWFGGRVFENGSTTGASATPTPKPSPSVSPTPMPQISKFDTKEFDRLGIKKGDQYRGPDGLTYTRGQ
jgi:hypothetical protein